MSNKLESAVYVMLLLIAHYFKLDKNVSEHVGLSSENESDVLVEQSENNSTSLSTAGSFKLSVFIGYEIDNFFITLYCIIIIICLI